MGIRRVHNTHIHTERDVRLCHTVSVRFGLVWFMYYAIMYVAMYKNERNIMKKKKKKKSPC